MIDIPLKIIDIPLKIIDIPIKIIDIPLKIIDISLKIIDYWYNRNDTIDNILFFQTQVLKTFFF